MANIYRGQFLGLFLIMALVLIIAQTQVAHAQTSQGTYLQELYSVLNELSQVGDKVSKTAISLQSAPEDKCENEFSFYQGIVSMQRARLSSATPPAGYKPVHIKAMEALSNYLTGLNLYGSACTDDDYEMKTKLVDRGTNYIKQADQQVAEVNDMVANPSLIPEYKTTIDNVEEWCGARWASNADMQQYCIKTQTEARAELSNMLQMNPEGTPGRRVIADCTNTWTDRTGSYNYRMIVFCSKNSMPR